jgi:signal peptidase
MTSITATTAARPARHAPATLGRVGHVLAWLVILAVGAVVTLAVLLPRIAGATPYTVMTGSMEPALPPGTLVVVRPVRPAAIGVGTVITYQLRSGEPTVVTHRVVAVREGRDGTPEFRTQGDANPAPDPAWVRPVQVRGEHWYHVRRLGYLNTWITAGARQAVTTAVVVGLLGYAAVMFGSSWRDRAGSRRRVTG